MAVAAMLGVAACVFIVAVAVGEGPERGSLWAAVVAAVAGVVAAMAALFPAVARPSRLVPPQVAVPEGVVDRPDEVAKVVTALLGGRAGTVGLTTGLHGAGGFAKTTLAKIVGADRRVRRRFRGGVYWVTVGRDVRGAGVAARVKDLIKQVAGRMSRFRSGAGWAEAGLTI